MSHNISLETDKLDRKKLADNLSAIVLNNPEKFVGNDTESLVISINSSWGTGKTTFINMWSEDLKNKGTKVIVYNSWEHDDWKDAFVPLLNHLIDSIDFSDCPDLLEDIRYNFKEVIKYIGTGVAKSILQRLDKELTEEIFSLVSELTESNWSEWFEEGIEFDEVKDLVKKMNFEQLFSHLKKEKIYEILAKRRMNLSILDEYKEFLKAKNSFKKQLQRIQSSSDLKRIIFIIDELDRCRPNFAIETLEVIKHFMDNPNIVYVFSLDIEQLSHSVATYYGQNMDSQGYLRRFFNLSFDMPLSLYHRKKYIEQLKGRYANSVVDVSVLAECAKVFDLSLRDIELAYKNASIMHLTVLSDVDSGSSLEFYYWVMVMKLKRPDLYQKLLYEHWLYNNRPASGDDLFDNRFIINSAHIGNMLVNLGNSKNRNKLSETIRLLRNAEIEFDNYGWCIDAQYRNRYSDYTFGEYIEEKIEFFIDTLIINNHDIIDMLKAESFLWL